MTEQQETKLLATLENVALELKRIREALEHKQEPEPKNPLDVCRVKPVGDDADQARDARFDGTTEEVTEAADLKKESTSIEIVSGSGLAPPEGICSRSGGL